MKKQILLAGILSMSVATTGFAAENFYTGGKISDRDGPDFTVEQTTAVEQDVATVKKEDKKETKKSKEGQKEVLPITLYGDNVIYHQDTGDFSADGNVRILQGKQTLHTVKLVGNMKTGDVFLNEGGRLVEEKSEMTGEWLHYNFNNKTGEIKKLAGTSGKDMFKANHGTIYEGKIVLDEGGQTTRCPAIINDPCVLVTAKMVEIYPQEKIVSHDVKVYIKGKHIYSRDLLVNRLDQKESQSFMPKIGYSDSDGVSLKLHYTHSFSEELSLNGDFNYYDKTGYRPMYSLNYDERNFYINVQNGWDEDSDDNWVKKESDIKVVYKGHHFSDKLPLTYSLYYNHGLWQDDWKKSWHTEYGMYINHDRIYFDDSKSLFLDMGAGPQWIKESYDDSTTNTMNYNARLGKKFDERWNTWAGYYWTKSENNLFAYNRPDMAEELQNGVTYKWDENNSLTFVNRYDLGKSSLYEQDWRYVHNFCCFQIAIEYRDEKHNGDKSWHIKYDLVRW